MLFLRNFFKNEPFLKKQTFFFEKKRNFQKNKPFFSKNKPLCQPHCCTFAVSKKPNIYHRIIIIIIMQRLLLLLILLLGSSLPLLAQTTRYVAATATGTANGSSWANASADLQAMINASAAGDEVRVATGTYKPTLDPFGSATPTDPRDKTFYVKDGVKLYGGYNAATGLRTEAPFGGVGVTRLSGDFNNNDVVTGTGATLSITNNTENAYHVVLASAATVGGIGVTIDGFSITGGNGNDNNTIIVNGNTIYRRRGGSITTYYGTNTLTNNTISGSASEYSYGAGIYTEYGTNTLMNNTLSGNTADSGAGIYTEYGTNTLTNNTLSGNTAYSGGGIYTYFGTNTLTNNTFSGNTANNSGGGIYTFSGTNTLTNNIFWANKTGSDATIQSADYYADGTNGNTFKNNILQLAASNYPVSNTGNYAIGTSATDNIFATNPLFVNAADPDGADNIWRTADDGLRLACGSPAYNTGTNTDAPATDILGTARPQFSTVDMGAYESTTNLTTTFNVTTLADAGAGSLRQAITDANAITCTAVIININIAGTISLQTALPSLTKSITINGYTASGACGSTVERDATLALEFRIFNIAAGNTCILNSLIIQKGKLSGSNYGAGINNAGTLTLNYCTVQDNENTNSGGGLNGNNITVNNSSILRNISTGGFGAAAIGNNIVFNNTTLGNNNSNSNALYGINITLRNTTMYGTGQGIQVTGELTLENSIVIGHNSFNINGNVNSTTGHNIIGSATGMTMAIGAVTTGNTVGIATNAVINTVLAYNNGGCTQTYALKPCGIAINAGVGTNNDQNNTAIFGGAKDIGASEYNTTPVYPIITAQPTTITICAGGTGSASVVATGVGLTYQWQYSNNGSTSATGNATAPGNTTATISGIPTNTIYYRCKITNANGCITYSNWVNGTTSPLLIITVTGATASASIVSLTASGGTNYAWSSGNTPNTATNTFTTIGVYTVTLTVSNSAGCSTNTTILIAVHPPCPTSTVLYVNAAIATSGNGTTFAQAYKTFDEALYTAYNCPAVTRINVATGIYKPTKKPYNDNGVEMATTDARDVTFHIRDGLGVYGGYDATTGLRIPSFGGYGGGSILSGDIDNNDTNTDGNNIAETAADIQGNNTYHVLIASARTVSSVGVVIDGFVITSGKTTNNTNFTLNVNSYTSVERDFGGGIWINYGTNTVTNNIISGNIASYGGGIYTYNSKNTLTNNTILGNKSIYAGGGLYIHRSTNTFTNNTILSNTANLNGGGLLIAYGTHTFTDNTISDNTAILGGGIRFIVSINTLNNNTISGNTATNNGGGIYSEFGSNTLVNNTFSGNTAINDGGGIYTYNGFNTFINNIFWSNKKDSDANIQSADYYADDTNGNTFKNNILQLAASNYSVSNTGNYGIGTAATGNIFAADPLFINAADPDGADNIWRTADDGLRLGCGSPAYNTGTNTNVPATDIIGMVRPQFGTVDMGAYESTTNLTNTFNVTTLADAGAGSLRQAITDANAALCTTTLIININIAGSITLQTALPSLSKNITINGYTVGGACGSTVERDAALALEFRIFNIDAENTCILNNLIIQKGKLSGNNYGGGINNAGVLTLNYCTVQNNQTYNSGGGLNGDNITVNNSSILQNISTAGYGTAAFGNNIVFNNTTIGNNIGNSNTLYGSNITLRNTTMYGTSAGIQVTGVLTLENSIVIGHNSFDINGSVNSTTGHNIIGSATNMTMVSGAVTTGNTVGITANLVISTALAYNNGGCTQTYIINPCGLAFNGGVGTDNDQNNTAIFGGAKDIGASEYATVPPVRYSTLYVDAAIATSGNGSTFAQAYKTLDEALEEAHNCTVVTRINVAIGTYKPTKKPHDNGVEMTTGDARDVTFHIRDGLGVYGGYNATTGLRTEAPFGGAGVTRLSGDFNSDDVVTGTGATLSITNNTENAYHVVLASAATVGGIGVTIDGFTITGGNGNDFNTIIVNGNTIYRRRGGSITTYYGINTLTNNTISGNASEYSYGGGIYTYYGTNTLMNNTLSGNKANSGGGIYTYYGTNTLINNTLSGNKASSGGGIYIYDGINTLTNNTLSGNTANTYGGGIYINYGTNTLTNNTLSGNTANSYGGGIYTYFSTNTLTNNIFWGNKKGSDPNIQNADYYTEGINSNTFKNNILQLAASNYTTTGSGSNDIGAAATGNIFATAPLFVNAADPDGADNVLGTSDDGFRLQVCSPAVNIGLNSAVSGIATDITGANRIQQTTVDLGAYESNHAFTPLIAYSVTGGGFYCTGGIAVGLSNSQTDITYQLINNSTNIGTPIAGTGAAISFGLQTAEGIYTVVATNISNGCTKTMSNSVTITSTPTVQVQALSTHNITGTNVNIEWNKGNGANTLVIAKAVSVASVSSIANITYTANTNFANASSSTIDGGKVVYFGNDDNVTITGLSPNTKYYFTIITANNCPNYLTTTPLIGFVSTTTDWTGIFTPSSTITGFPGTLRPDDFYPDGWFTNEDPSKAIDDDRLNDKYLNLQKNGAGIEVIGTSPSIAKRLEIVSVSENGYLTRNPKTVKVEGKTTNGTYTTLIQQTLPENTTANIAHFIDFENTTAYDNYKVTVIDVYGANVMQVREIQLYGEIPAICPSGNTLYVNSSVPVGGAGNGNTWANAYASLSDALEKAHQCNNVTTIKVAAGTYKPTKKPFNSGVEMITIYTRDVTFHVRDGLSVYGGYDASTNTRDIAVNATTLSGDIGTNGIATDNAYHVVVASAAGNGGIGVTIDGFTIIGGNANGYGGIVLNGNYFYENSGGGIYCSYGINTLTNNTLLSNTASFYGGGVYTTYSTNTLTNNTLSGNTATTLSGGGIYALSSTNVLTNNTFSGNTASFYGGGICTQNGTNTLTNNTFSGNTATTNFGGAVYTNSNTNVLTNNIFWGNKKGSDASAQGADCYLISAFGNTLKNNILQLAASNYTTFGVGPYDLGTAATGNIFAANPLFVNAADPDGADNIWRTADDGLRLANCGSSALNTGFEGAAVPTLDILGNATVSRKDIGAYENQTDCLNNIYADAPTCQTFSVQNVRGNAWFNIYGTNGILASINPNGANLGTVTVEISDAVNAIPFNSKQFLGRSLNITSSAYATNTPIPTAYSMRIYYYDTELDEYNTAMNGTYGLTDFGMAWKEGGTGCTLATYGGSNNGLVANADITEADYGLPLSGGSGGVGFYLGFNLNHFTIFAATTATPIPLPVKWLKIAATPLATYGKITDRVMVEWATASEHNLSHYFVERGALENGNLTWTNIGRVTGKNSPTGAYYNFYDTNIKGLNEGYYRVISVDFDGTTEASTTVHTTFKKGTETLIYPNPTDDIITISVETYDRELPTILRDIHGKTIYSYSTTPYQIDLSTLPAAVYLLQIGSDVSRVIKE
jgi:parallel beta-helix repeat protein